MIQSCLWNVKSSSSYRAGSTEDANKTAVEETRWQLHKNAACNPEQVLAATPHKTPTVRPPAPITKTIQVRRTRHAGHCWRSRGELIRDVLLWIPTHGRAKAGRPARTYIQQLCEDTGCCPEDLPRNESLSITGQNIAIKTNYAKTTTDNRHKTNECRLFSDWDKRVYHISRCGLKTTYCPFDRMGVGAL